MRNSHSLCDRLFGVKVLCAFDDSNLGVGNGVDENGDSALDGVLCSADPVRNGLLGVAQDNPGVLTATIRNTA